MHAIVCLGNPGAEYAKTRHSVGFMVADQLAAANRIELGRSRMRAVFGRGQIAGQDCLVIKPQTFMNDSGDAARRVVHFYRIPQEQFVVVYDDMALELGVLRVRRDGSDAGHKGLRSIIAHMGTSEIARVRLGVGAAPAGMDARDWVLSDFKPGERDKVQDMVGRAAEAVECWLAHGLDTTMNRYNG
jgi:peptidyl-tRNA hydrolase, PTH1 family